MGENIHMSFAELLAKSLVNQAAATFAAAVKQMNLYTRTSKTLVIESTVVLEVLSFSNQPCF